MTTAPSPLALLTRPDRAAQRALREFLESTVRGKDRGDEQFTRPPGDPGLYGPASAMWEVHSDASLLVGGISALFLQTLHPLAMAGVADHSDFQRDPLGRLQRTAGFVVTTTFGSRAAAERAVESVRRIHTRVHGHTPDGRPYDATDPDLAVWVHATEISSFLQAVRTFGVTPVDDTLADRYIAEAALVAEMLGARNVPHSLAEMDAYFAKVLPGLERGAQAEDCLRFLKRPPLPWPQLRMHRILARGAVDILPAWGRERLGLRGSTPLQRVVNQRLVRSAVATMRWAMSAAPTAHEMALARCAAKPEARSAA